MPDEAREQMETAPSPRSGRFAAGEWSRRRGVRDAAIIVAGEKIVDVVAPGDIPATCPVEDVARSTSSCQGSSMLTCTSMSLAGPSGKGSRRPRERRPRAESRRSSTCRSTARP